MPHTADVVQGEMMKTGPKTGQNAGIPFLMISVAVSCGCSSKPDPQELCVRNMQILWDACHEPTLGI